LVIFATAAAAVTRLFRGGDLFLRTRNHTDWVFLIFWPNFTLAILLPWHKNPASDPSFLLGTSEAGYKKRDTTRF
jgi:hypothetical protein